MPLTFSPLFSAVKRGECEISYNNNWGTAEMTHNKSIFLNHAKYKLPFKVLTGSNKENSL